jgi:hypothetical protein
VIVRTVYNGEHNFGWDCRLEELAGQCRVDAGMDFESMDRWIDFVFPDKKISDEFIVAVKHEFEGFTTEIDPPLDCVVEK